MELVAGHFRSETTRAADIGPCETHPFQRLGFETMFTQVHELTVIAEPFRMVTVCGSISPEEVQEVGFALERSNQLVLLCWSRNHASLCGQHSVLPSAG